MDYITVRIAVRPPEIESLCEKLMDLGVGGVQIEDKQDFESFLEHNKDYWDYVDANLITAFDGGSCVKVYVENNAEGRSMLERIKDTVGAERITTLISKQEDWANNWKKYFQPIELERIIIKPAWETLSDTHGKTVMSVDPGMSFGSGQHETTRMCLEFLEQYVCAGAKVLDLGCGSGILSVASLLLGAARAFGVDIDPAAARVARENAKENGVGSRFGSAAGNIVSDSKLQKKAAAEKYDIVAANIVADVIIALCPHVGEWMRPGAVFICSGIIDTRVEEAVDALLENDFQIKEKRRNGDWYAIVSERRKHG
ncbi:MAG: 50S ribosomal protein L11 methyltransferase [Clostridia bacterium]|nr:50S ribosomal protein L11 methyltransferase [Clostridia bacterium]